MFKLNVLDEVRPCHLENPNQQGDTKNSLSHLLDIKIFIYYILSEVF